MTDFYSQNRCVCSTRSHRPLLCAFCLSFHFKDPPYTFTIRPSQVSYEFKLLFSSHVSILSTYMISPLLVDYRCVLQ